MAYRKLEKSGHLSTRYHVSPRNNAVDLKLYPNGPDVEVPSLFEMYLRLGAEVCGPPTIDREFGTIDFFVVLDADRMNDRYRRMFGR